MIFLAAGFGYFWISIFKHLNYQSNAFDLAIFAQTSWLIGHLQEPYSTVRMIFQPADHFTPTYWLLSLPYGLFNSPVYLLALQALSVLVGGVAVWLIARKVLESRVSANFLLVAYFGQLGVINALAFDFSTTALSVGFTAWAIYFWLEKRYWPYVALFFLALGCKEDMPVLFGAFSLLMLYRREWKWFWTTLLGSTGWYLGVMYYVMPVLFDHPNEYNQINGLGHGWAAKEQSVRQIFGQNLWLSLANPIGILFSAANLLTRFAKNGPNYWGNEFHYGANIAAPLIISTAFGVKTFIERTGIHRQTGRVLIPAAIAVVTFTGMGAVSGIVRALPVSRHQIDRALQTVPANASVSAQSALSPHLSNRKDIYLFPRIGTRCDKEPCPNVEYIVLSDALNAWPLTNEQLIEAKDQIEANQEYEKVLDENSVLIYKKK